MWSLFLLGYSPQVTVDFSSVFSWLTTLFSSVSGIFFTLIFLIAALVLFVKVVKLFTR